MTRSRMLAAPAILLAAAMLLTACQEAKAPEATPEPPKKAEGDAKAPEVKPGQDAPVPADKAADKTADAKTGPCKEYADKLCVAVGGDKIPTCGAVRITADIMAPQACTAGLANMDFSIKAISGMKAKCGTLVEKLCKDLGTETETCKMVTERTKEFPPDRCAMMLERYPDVLKELQAQEMANKPLSAEQQATITAGNVAAFGPKDAKVTIVEFSDFQCPYCVKAYEVTDAVKKKYSDKVRVIFRQFPLSFHKEAHLAGQASLAAHEQGKFWEYHDKLFLNQKALGRPDLEKYAAELKLDMPKFKKALDDGTYKATVDAELKMGGEVFVQGTPTMFLNGQRISNPTDIALVTKMIETELAK